MKYLLKVLVFIPLGIELLLLLVMVSNKLSGIVWVTHIAITMLLTLIGLGIISKKKIMQKLWSVALVTLTVLLFIIGYYDFVKWFSSIVGIILFLYFIFMRILVKRLKIV